jgi:hypothetical protein
MAVGKDLMTLFMLTHWGACFWYLAAKIDTSGDNWIQAYIRDFPESGLGLDSPGHLYLRSLYNSVSIMYGGTCADGYMPITDAEHLMAVFLVIGGATSYAYAIGGICGFVENRDRATKEFHVAVDNMNLFMSDHAIPRELRVQTRAFFQRARPVLRSQFYNETLSTCSPDLRAKIVLQMHSHWFDKLAFFKAGPIKEQHQFIMALAVALKTEVCAQGDVVIHYGELCNKMWIVYKGLCACLGKIMASKSIMGQDMILSLTDHRLWRRHYQANALTFCQLYLLTYKEFENVLDSEDLPKTRLAIRKAAIRICFCRTIVAVANSEKMRNEVQGVGNADRKNSQKLVVEHQLELENVTSVDVSQQAQHLREENEQLKKQVAELSACLARATAMSLK